MFRFYVLPHINTYSKSKLWDVNISCTKFTVSAYCIRFFAFTNPGIVQNQIVPWTAIFVALKVKENG